MTPKPPAPSVPHRTCNCKRSDAWRCAREANLDGQIACHCSCHRLAPSVPQQRVQFTPYFEVEAVGQRIGFVSCRLCGATVLIGDQDFNATKAHEVWHER